VAGYAENGMAREARDEILKGSETFFIVGFAIEVAADGQKLKIFCRLNLPPPQSSDGLINHGACQEKGDCRGSAQQKVEVHR
jgi:hypothetical protein